MKIIIVSILAFTLLFTSCRKENTPENTNEDFVQMSSDMLIAESAFMDAARYETKGTAKYYSRANDQLLRLENFKTDNGPALKVYISSDDKATDFIDLGALKAVSGNQNYSISKNINLSNYPFVLIWCEQFSVLFGSAEVK